MSSNMSRSGHQVLRVAKEEVDISGVEPVGMNPPENKPKRKRYRRHTPEQIQAMEEFFKEFPHPDNKQRTELSQVIGIDPSQVKFWFQNKHTQMKMIHNRQQNANLRAEKEKLHAENVRFRDALSNATCVACGCMTAIGDVTLDEHYLRMENARLRDEINRISGVAANYVRMPLANPFTNPSYSVLRATSLRTGPMFRGSSSKGNGAEDSGVELKNNKL